MAKLPKNLKFEEALARLESIVSAMESGEIGIEESIARYEEAMALATHCRQILDAAELRIQQIQADAAGRLTATPFEAPAAADDPPEADDGDDPQSRA